MEKIETRAKLMEKIFQGIQQGDVRELEHARRWVSILDHEKERSLTLEFIDYALTEVRQLLDC